jgi:hypothetical protein
MNLRDLGVLLASAVLGAFLIGGSGCVDDGGCSCGSGQGTPLENGEYQVSYSEPETPEVEGASVFVSKDNVTISYEVNAEAVSVEYAVTGIRVGTP